MKIFPDMPPEDITQTVMAQEQAKQYNKLSVYQKFKIDNHYQKAVNHNKDGRMCAKCKFLDYDPYHQRNYYKCKLLGTSRGEATDIRLSYVCDRFEINPEIIAEAEAYKKRKQEKRQNDDKQYPENDIETGNYNLRRG